jgi:hypothetical protein
VTEPSNRTRTVQVALIALVTIAVGGITVYLVLRAAL